MSQVIIFKHTDELVLREKRCYCLDIKRIPIPNCHKYTAVHGAPLPGQQ